jgi:hypothetical protein
VHPHVAQAWAAAGSSDNSSAAGSVSVFGKTEKKRMRKILAGAAQRTAHQ